MNNFEKECEQIFEGLEKLNGDYKWTNTIKDLVPAFFALAIGSLLINDFSKGLENGS